MALPGGLSCDYGHEGRAGTLGSSGVNGCPMAVTPQLLRHCYYLPPMRTRGQILAQFGTKRTRSDLHYGGVGCFRKHQKRILHSQCSDLLKRRKKVRKTKSMNF